MTGPIDLLDPLRETIARQGFAFVDANDMAPVLDLRPEDLVGFSESWNDLHEDRYMKDGGRYRRRRHATFDVTSTAIFRRSHEPHYQTTDFNRLNGGIERWFEPIDPAVADHPAMLAIMTTCRALFDALTPVAARPKSWFVEVHQFRILAGLDGPGLPTPEGAHRDGVDWVLVLLLKRENIASGVTTIADLDHRELGSFTLTRPLDAAIVDDTRVFHGVTPVEPIDPAQPSFRDVLVVTFRRAS